MSTVDRARNGNLQVGLNGQQGTRYSSKSSNTPMTVPHKVLSSESRHSDVETDVWSQPGQWPENNPAFVGNNRSNSVGPEPGYFPAVEWSPQRQWSEDKTNSGNDRPSYNYQLDAVQEKHLKMYSTEIGLANVPSRGQNHGVRVKNVLVSPETRQESVKNVDEWEKELHTSRTEILDYQQRVLQHQQELEDLETINVRLRTELCIARDELRKVKADNIKINDELLRLQSVDKQKEKKLREFENYSNSLSYQITIAQSEKNEALGHNEKLQSMMTFLDKRIYQFYSNVKRTFDVDLKTGAIPGKVPGWEHDSKNLSSQDKVDELEGLYNKLLKDLIRRKQDNLQFEEENRRLKEALRALKSQISTKIQEPDRWNMRSRPKSSRHQVHGIAYPQRNRKMPNTCYRGSDEWTNSSACIKSKARFFGDASVSAVARSRNVKQEVKARPNR